jgi:arylsulfatase A-like enzyme
MTTEPMVIEPGTLLEFAVATEEITWTIDSAPVTMRIEAIDSSRVLPLYERVLDPARVPGDRGWLDDRLALDAIESQTVKLRFSAAPVDPADDRPQLPLWADPRLRLPGRTPATPSIVLVSLDTLRSRSMSTYGNTRETSPRFTAMAERGVLFGNASTTYPNTLGSHMSLFTGLYPATHRVLARGNALSPSRTPLGELLEDAGYLGAAFTEDAMLYGLAGFHRGFDYYYENSEISPGAGDAAATFGRAIDWLRKQPARPVFLFAHTYAVHSPYDPGLHYTQLFDEGYDTPKPPPSLRAYEQEIRELDDHLAEFIASLEEIIPSEELLIVIVSDHGEGFGEHGLFEHLELYDEVMQVPVFVRWEGRIAGGRHVMAPVSLVDIAPTILGLIGAASETLFEGLDLSEMLLGRSESITRSAVYGQSPPHRFKGYGWSFIARDERFKCFVFDGDKAPRCYDLESDPFEQDPMALEPGTAAHRLLSLAARYSASGHEESDAPPTEGVDLPAGVIDKLEALGYVEDM